MATDGISLRFPTAETGGYFDTGGDPDRLADDTFVNRLTRESNDGPTGQLVYDGGVIPVEFVPSGKEAAKLTAGQKPFANIGVSGSGYVQPYWRSVLLYKQRPLWLIRLLTLDCLFASSRFFLTRAQWIWFANFVCLILHTFMAVLTFERGGRNSDGMKVSVWRLQQTWDNTTKLGYNVAVVDNGSPIRLDLLTGAFFTLSAVAHLFAVAVGPWDRWISIYWRQLDLAFVWWRWLEYSVSASVMMLAIALITGLREANALATIFVLMWVTQLFGLLTELYSRPAKVMISRAQVNAQLRASNFDSTSIGTLSAGEGVEGASSENKVTAWAMYRWQGDLDKYTIGDSATPEQKMLHYRRIGSARLYNYLYRTIPLTIGVFPYVTAWVILLNHFFTQLEDLKKLEPHIYDLIPEWITIAVAGTAIVFTLFTFPIAWYQWQPPMHYWKTELWYCLLSATSKMILGLLLYTNVIYLGDVDEALSFLNTTAVNVTALAPVV